MNLILEKKDAVNATLKINIVESDYSPNYKARLKEYGKKVQLKGFREGMVPLSLVEKMHGKTILVEQINTLISYSINEYLKDNKLEILGDPLPDEKSVQAIDWENQKDFQFEYQLGLAPQFSIELSDKIKIVNYKISYTDKILKETTENLRKQFGKYEDAEISIEDDIIYADATDENGKSYKAIIPQYRVSEAEKANFIGLTLGQTFTKNVRETYDDDATIAHIFAIDKKEAPFLNGNITYTITKISQQKLAEINEEFYAKVFRGQVIVNFADFEAKLAENIDKSYEMEARNALFNEIFDFFTANTAMELPKEFLKKWLLYSNQGKISMAQIEAEFDKFEAGLKWDLIKNKIALSNDIKIDKAEVMDRAMQVVLSQVGIAPTALDENMKNVLMSMTDNYVKKDNGKEYKRLFEQVFTEKVINFIASKIKLVEEKVDIEKFTLIQKTKAA